MPTKPEKSPRKPLNAYAKYSSLGIQMAIIIGGGCYGGYKLDEYYKNSNSVFTIILSLVSIGLAMYVVLRTSLSQANNSFMQNQKKYYFQLILVSVGALLLSYGLSQVQSPYLNARHFWIPTVFFAITTLGTNLLLTSGDKQSKEFVFKSLAMTMARLLACMIFVFVYSLINKPQVLAFSCHFMIQYVLFTVFEMSFLVKYIKQAD